MLAPSSSIPVPSQTRAIVLLAVAGFASQAMVRSADSLLPQIAGDFGVTVGAASIVVSAYSVVHGSMQLVSGPVGEGTPSSTPVIGRRHLDLNAGRAVQPRNVATRCGRRSPSGTAALWTVDRGSTRRRRGRENSPPRPTIRGMTVVDRPTISGQFLDRFRVKRILESAGLTIDAVMAETLYESLEEVKSMNAMIAMAEARRNAALCEIERHRAALACALRRTLSQVEDAQYSALEIHAGDKPRATS